MDRTSKARRSTYWNAGLTGLQRLLQVGLTLILVRLLTPEDYGQYAVLNSVLVFLTVISSQGFVEYLLHCKEDPRQDGAVFLAGAFLHLVIFAICLGLAFLFSLTEHYGAIAEPLMVASVAILLNHARIFASTVLRRSLDWSTIRKLHLTGFALYAACSITLAFQGFGIYALIAGNVVVPLPYLFWLVAQNSINLPKRRALWNLLRPSFSFGAFRTTSAGVHASGPLLQSGIFTGMFGFASYGYFTRAMSYNQLLAGSVLGQVAPSIYPAMAQIKENRKRLVEVSRMLLTTNAWAATVLLGITALCAEPLIPVLFGPGWEESATLAPAAAIVVWATLVCTSMSTVYVSAIGARAALILDVSILMVTVGVLLLSDSASDYMTNLALGFVILTAAALIVLVRVNVLTVRDILAIMGFPAGAVGLAIIITPVLTDSLGLASAVLLFVSAFCLCARFVFSERFRELLVAAFGERLAARVP